MRRCKLPSSIPTFTFIVHLTGEIISATVHPPSSKQTKHGLVKTNHIYQDDCKLLALRVAL